MDQLYKWLSENWITVIISGVVGFFVNVLTSHIYRTNKVARYAISSASFAKTDPSKIPGLSLQFNGAPIDTLTVTRIAFWNGGQPSIKREEIVRGDPIRVVCDAPAQLLGAEVAVHNNQASEFESILRQDKSAVDLNWAYLNRNQGAVVHVFHTGGPQARVHVEGQILDAGKPRRVWIVIVGPKRQQRWLFAVASALLPFVLAAALISESLKMAKLYTKVGEPIPWGDSFGIAIPLILLVAGICWAMSYFLVRRPIPKGLDIFEQQF